MEDVDQNQKYHRSRRQISRHERVNNEQTCMANKKAIGYGPMGGLGDLSTLL